MSQIFYFGDLRAKGQVNFVTLPPHNKPMGNVKMLLVSHKPTETTQFFQDHGHPFPSVMIQSKVQLMIGGYVEVT